MIPYAFLAIPLLIAAALAMPFVGISNKRFPLPMAIATTFLSIMLTMFSIPDVIEQKFLVLRMAGFAAPFGINLVLDSFSLFVMILVAFTGFLSVLLSRRFIRRRAPEYYSLLLLALAGLCGVAATADLFNMFVFMELAAVSSYALTAYYRDEASVEGGIKYLLVGGLGTMLFLLGTAFIYVGSGSLSLAHIAQAVGSVQGVSRDLFVVAIGMIFAGLMIKTALVPFHAWKPDAVEAAPVPVAMLFTSASATVGAYAIFRLTLTVLGLASFYHLFAILGVISMVVGAVMALQQNNIKRLLAYSSISQMGYVFLAFSMGRMVAEGFTGALFHLLNLVIIDVLLFFSAGILIHHTNTGEMDEMSKLLHPKASKAVSASFLIGVLSLAGVPFSGGFSSKWLIYVAGMKVNPFLTFLALMVSVVTLGYGFKAFDLMFLSGKCPKPKRMKVSILLKGILIMLSGLCILLGLFPQIGIQFAEMIISTSFDGAKYIAAVVG